MLIDWRLFRDHANHRIFKRSNIYPCFRVKLNIDVFNYEAFDKVYKDFTVVAGATTYQTLSAGAKLLLGKQLTSGGRKGRIVSSETRTAVLGEGDTRPLELLHFQGFSKKSGWNNVKLLKGNDYSVPYSATVRYRLRCSPTTLRVYEQVEVVFSTVTILDGTTLAWPNSERVGRDEKCLTQDQRHSIAEYLRFVPRKATSHARPTTPEVAVPAQLDQQQHTPTAQEEASEEARLQLEEDDEEEKLVSPSDILNQQ